MCVELVHAICGAGFVDLYDALEVAYVRLCLVLACQDRAQFDQVVLLQEFGHFAELEAVTDPGCGIA